MGKADDKTVVAAATPTNNKNRPRGNTSSNKAAASNDQVKKFNSHRGRPREVAIGESRIDRRRKQIREAQFAYRQRKDQAIADLEARVEKLEEINKDIVQEVFGLIDVLHSRSTANSDPEVSQRCQELSNKLSSSSIDPAECSLDGMPRGTTAAMDIRSGVSYMPMLSPDERNQPAFRQGHAFRTASTTSEAALNDNSYVITETTPENGSLSGVPYSQASDTERVQSGVISRQMRTYIGLTDQSSGTYSAVNPAFGHGLHRSPKGRGLDHATENPQPTDFFGVEASTSCLSSAAPSSSDLAWYCPDLASVDIREQ
jgi:hypothetical protein